MDSQISRRWICAVLFLSVMFFVVAAWADQETGFTETATLLGKIPKDAALVSESIIARPDVGKIGYVYQEQSGKFRACMNGRCGPPVDQVSKDFVISPDGEHVAAVVQNDGKIRVMLNGSIGRGHDMVYSLRFSPDSMKLAYIAREDKKFVAYVNQDRHQEFAFIDPNLGIVFSPDSSRLAYAASPDGKSWTMVENNKQGPAYGGVKLVMFSPDSKRLAYAAKIDGKWHMVEGDDISPPYDQISNAKFGPRSENLAYIGVKLKESVMVQNGKPSPSFEVIPGTPLFSPDGKRLAYAVAEKDNDDFQMRLMVDGRIGPAFARIGAYQFSGDGRHIAYMAEKDEKGMMVHDGNIHEAYESVGIPVFGPDGQLAYMALHDGQWHIWQKGKLGEKGFSRVENPVFAPKGTRMAYTALLGPVFMVVEGDKTLGPFQWAGSPGFSPDGKHMIFGAALEDEFFLVIDGKPGKERFATFLKGSGLIFVDDWTLQGFALRDNGLEFWLIRAEIGR